MNSSSLISPRSNRNRGSSSPSSRPTRIALPRFSGEIPTSSWKAAKAAKSGVVRTPPKSETIARKPLVGGSAMGAAGDLVGAEALAALDRPAAEGNLRLESLAAHVNRADQGAGAAQRAHRLDIGPQLQGRPALDAVFAVLGREQRFLEAQRRPVGVAKDRRALLFAVGLGAGGEGRAERQQTAVGENDPDRPPHHWPALAHARQPSDCLDGAAELFPLIGA